MSCFVVVIVGFIIRVSLRRPVDLRTGRVDQAGILGFLKVHVYLGSFSLQKLFYSFAILSCPVVFSFQIVNILKFFFLIKVIHGR